jgi:hypothetical protein
LLTRQYFADKFHSSAVFTILIRITKGNNIIEHYKKVSFKFMKLLEKNESCYISETSTEIGVKSRHNCTDNAKVDDKEMTSNNKHNISSISLETFAITRDSGTLNAF